MSVRQAVPNDQRVAGNRIKIQDTLLSVVLTPVETSGYQPHSHHFCVSVWSRLRDGVMVFFRVRQDPSDMTEPSVTTVLQITRHSITNGDRQLAEITTILLCLF
jgi:hypothetical protein